MPPVRLQCRANSSVGISSATEARCLLYSKRFKLFSPSQSFLSTRFPLKAPKRNALGARAKPSGRGGVPTTTAAELSDQSDQAQQARLQQHRRDELDKLCTQCKRLRFPSCPELVPREVWERVNTGDVKLLIVDTRRDDERQVSMLPGSVSQREFEARKDAFSDCTICCYCTVGFRSGAYAEKLRGEGLEAFNIRGSILAWAQEGLPLVKREEGTERVTRQVHTFSKRWAHLCGADHSAVYFQFPMVKAVGQMLGGLW